jgi:hypothetical protein
MKLNTEPSKSLRSHLKGGPYCAASNTVVIKE